MKRALQHFWTLPNSLLGLLGGIGGRFKIDRKDGVCEVVGGWLMALTTWRRWAGALTWGDVILYADAATRLSCREHEMVHVRQYRLWGPVFLPAYLLESLYQWLRTGDGYYHNRFERDAYEK